MKAKLLRFPLFLLLFTGLTAYSCAQETGSGNKAVFDEIRAGAKAIGSVRSLLIQQNGDRILEQYYYGMQPERKMNIKSASKSIMALLVGIAIEKGLIESVNDPIYKYLPEYFENISNSEKRNITIRHLLIMQSGLETTSFSNYGAWVISDDWVEYALEQPMVKRPGGKWAYSTGSTHLLSAIITEASGMSTRAFANRYLFGPMNIEPGGWERGPQGYYMGGNQLWLSSEAMMKIGQMVLNGGTWMEKRIVPKLWLEKSLQTYGRSSYNPYNYGYGWWNRMVAGHKVYFAWGYGGQYIFIIPDLDSVVVVLSSLKTATQQRDYQEPVFQILGDLIINKVLE